MYSRESSALLRFVLPNRFEDFTQPPNPTSSLLSCLLFEDFTQPPTSSLVGLFCLHLCLCLWVLPVVLA